MPCLSCALAKIVQGAARRYRARQDPLLACDECCRRVAIERVRYFNSVGDSSSA